jgi:cardiolipin synthase A/B
MTRVLRNAYLPDNNVRLVRGGKEYFDLLVKMIREAKYSINLQVYIFDEDETGNHVIDALIEAAQRSVRVYILVDGYASQHLSKEFVQRVKNAGIYFKRFEPLLKSKYFYFGRRMHHKVVVVDGFYSLVGGINIGNRYNDRPDKQAWLDWALYTEGKVSESLYKICVKRMKRPRLKTLKEVHPVLHQITNERKCMVRARENDWVGRKRQIYNSYLEIFREASSQIIIMSPYFLPGNEFRRKMRMANKRGVKIKLVLAGISDIFLSKHAERFVYRWLLKNNIEIYEYQNNVLHGKMAVCDDVMVTVGSYNVNDLSAHASIELNLDVKDGHFAKHVTVYLEEIIKNDCVCITSEVYKKETNIFKRIIQRFAYDFFRLVLFLFTFYFRQRE